MKRTAMTATHMPNRGRRMAGTATRSTGTVTRAAAAPTTSMAPGTGGKTAAAMSQVLPAEEYQPVETDYPNVTAMNRALSGGETVGYVVEVTASGFGGAMSMVVGVDADGAVTGVAVTDHSETANIGTKVVDDQAVLDRFIGMSHGDGEIPVNAGPNRFDGVSGATVSSRGVTAGVNTALAAAAEQKGGQA